jgi:hypothetical protein
VLYSYPSVRKAWVPAVFAGVLMLVASASGVLAQSTDCQTELGTSSGFTTLGNGGSTSQTAGVVEWDGEVLKLGTNTSGVLTINASGSRSRGSLYTQGSSTPHPLVNRANIGTSQRDLKVVVPAGHHCIELTPGPGASGDITLTVSFVDSCHLGTPDDHGDSFLCATPITVGGSSASGEITSTSSVDDVDMFVLTLTSSATVTIASSGGGYVGGSLYDGSGSLITSDNTGWSAANFSITQSLSAGTYYIEVTGPDSATYGLSVTSGP